MDSPRRPSESCSGRAALVDDLRDNRILKKWLEEREAAERGLKSKS